jgi:hypothetical protein
LPDTDATEDSARPRACPSPRCLPGRGRFTALGLEFALLQFRQPPLHWSGPILFDEAARNYFRGSTPQIRAGATTASWTLLGTEMAYPLAVDIPYAWSRYGKRVASDLLWQDATAMSISAAADG